MPFSIEEFFGVFARYNEAIWPLQIATYAAGALIVASMFGGGHRRAIVVSLGLAAMWILNGFGYHWLFFSAINPLARVFAVLFVVEAVMLAAAPFLGRNFQFEADFTAGGFAGLTLIAFAAIAYPLWGWLAGHVYPAVPVFGVAPCPTTIFTIGVLLTGTWRMVRYLLVIPLIWSAIGGSAAILLEVPQDYGLVVAGLTGVLAVFAYWRGGSVKAS